MLGLLRRSDATTPLAVYATGVLALLLHPQEYEVDAARYIATTEIPEMLLRRLQSVVKELHGRAHLPPYPSSGGCPVDLDTHIVYAPASVNEEVDNEEPKLSTLGISRFQLRYSEFLSSLDILSNVVQYVEVLAPVLQNGGIELVHFLLSSQSPMMVSYGLSCLSSLVTHPKFATVFLARDGLMLLIARPCAVNGNPYPFVKHMSDVLNNLVQYASTVEQICLLTDQVHEQLLELMFWLFESGQEESLKTLMISLARLLVYETFVDVFHRQGHITLLLNKWKFFQAIVDGKFSPAPASETLSTRATSNGFEITLNIPQLQQPLRPIHRPTAMDVDHEDSIHQSSETSNTNHRETNDKDDIPFYAHLKMTSPSSARALVDHLFLVFSEYFAASCVQASMASSRRISSSFSSSSSTVSAAATAPTPRYRATNVSNEHMAALNFAQLHLTTLPDLSTFVSFGGLELLFHSVYSNVPGVPNSQTCTDIVNAGLKMLWIFTALEQTADMIVNLSIQLPETNSSSSTSSSTRNGDQDHFARRIAALLRPNDAHADDIPIVHGLNWQPRMWRRRGEDGDVEEDGQNGENAGGTRTANAPSNGQNGAQNGEGRSHLERMDLTNIRLEPVNQRLVLERNSSRLRASSIDQTNHNAGNTASASSPATTTNNTSSAADSSRMDEDAHIASSASSSAPPRHPGPAGSQENEANGPISGNTSQVQPHSSGVSGENGASSSTGPSAASSSSTATPAHSRVRRSSNWMLLNILRRICVSSPLSGVYILQIFNNYFTVAYIPRNHLRSEKVAYELRSLNGLSQLVSLLRYHEISVSAHTAQHQRVASAPIDWNVVRTHAMTVLINLARSDDAISQILSKKLQTTLPDLLRTTCPPGQEKSFSKFKEEALKFFASPSMAINYNKRDEEAINSTNELSKLERASILANTPIRYSKHELLELIYQHLYMSGYRKAAESLAEDAKLSPEKMRPPPPPSVPKSRARRSSMLGSASSSAFTNTSATPGPFHADAPVSEIGFLSEAPSSQITLETIVKQFLYEQHKHCHHPVQVLPDLSLHSKHSCPDPIRHRMNPYGLNSMNLAHRLMSHSLKHAPIRSSVWRQHKYSRFAPRRKFSDGGLLTSVSFVDDSNIYFGSGDGLVVRYNVSSVNYDDEWEVREGPVDIKISRSSRRVLTMCESQSCIVGAPEDMKIWDLSNMGHDLGTLPFVTGQFSNSGQEVIGTGSHGVIALWDVSSGTTVRTFNDSTRTMMADEEERRSTRAMRTLQTGHFSPDDCLVLYNSTLWDKRKPSPIHSFDRFAASYGSQVFSPSGLEVITNTEVWDSRSFKLLKTVPSLHRAVSLTYSHRGDVLFCGSRSKFEVLDGTTYDYVSQVVLESSFASLSINPDDTQLAVLENLSPEHWPAESAWRIWDIGSSRTLDEEEADEENENGDEEDENAAALADFEGHTDEEEDEEDDDDDEEEEDGGAGGVGEDDNEEDDEDDLDGGAGGRRGMRRRRHHHHLLHHPPFGFMIHEGDEEGIGGTGEDGSSEMDEEDEEEEGEEWDTDTDYLEEDDLVGSDGEPMYIIDDYDSEGEGLFDEGDLDSEELAEISRQLGEEQDDEQQEEDVEDEDNHHHHHHHRRRRRHQQGESSLASSSSRRGAKATSSAAGASSSVFLELPSDEDEANELLEHGNIAGMTHGEAVHEEEREGDGNEEDDDSELSVIEFDDEGVAHPQQSSSPPTASSAPRAASEDSTSRRRISSSSSSSSSSATRRRGGPPVMAAARRTGAAATATASATMRSVRGLPTLRELSEMLGLVPKRSASAQQGTEPASHEEEEEEAGGGDEESGGDHSVESPPPKKKPKKKD